MTVATPPKARWAIFSVFLLHGILTGAWVPHVALAKERLGVGPGVFGIALLALAGGSVLAMPIAGAAINKYGSARVILFTAVFYALAFFAPTLAPSLPGFVIGGLALGAAIGSLDVAMNAHGIAVEKTLKIPILSSLHGGWSLGAMAGAFSGGVFVQNFGAFPHVLAMSFLFLIGQLVATRYLLPDDIDRGLSGSNFAWPTAATLGLGALCFLSLMIEGSVLDWAAILVREKFVVDAGIAALAFGFYQGGMALVRFGGDRLRLRFGAVNLVIVSAVLAAVGTTLALLSPLPWLAFAGFFAGGLGIGNVAPVLFAGGGRLEPDAPGRGIAAVTTMGYAGFLAGPPLIGFAAQFSTLTTGLFLTVIAALIIAVFAKRVAAADTY